MSSPAVQPILVLLGAEVGGNPLQYMMEKAFAHHDLDWRYLSVEVEPGALPDALRGVRAMGFRGGHCAEPHRATAGSLLDGQSNVARLAGAVNLFRREDDRLVGENVEGKAVVEALRGLVDPSGKRVVVIGAGRVARATALELAAAGAAGVTVANRTAHHAGQLVELLSEREGLAAAVLPWAERIELPADTDVLVHASSFSQGRGDAELPLALDTLRAETTVVDLTLDPPDTRLLREAEKKDCATLDGLTVFIEQVALAFRLWTGRDANRDVLREAVEEFLEL